MLEKQIIHLLKILFLNAEFDNNNWSVRNLKNFKQIENKQFCKWNTCQWSF